MNAKNKKLISTLLIIFVIVSAVLFSKPKQAKADCIWANTPVTPCFTTDIPNASINTAHTTVSTIAKIILGVQTGSTLINTGHVVVNAGLEVMKQAVMIAERQLLQTMTKSITGWINNGFHGSPLFLVNSDSFFHDIAKTEIKTLVNEFGYDPNRFPFGQAFALNTINAYKQKADANAAYSLSAVMTDPIMLRNYQNNFNTGGWNGFLINTQYPQNNYLGFQMLATDKLARQLAGTTQNAAQKVQTTLNQGMGFLSPQICQTNPKYNNMVNEFNKPTFQSNLSTDFTARVGACYGPTGSKSAPGVVSDCIAQVTTNYNRDLATEKTKWDETNTCPPQANGSSGLVNTTPGSVAANQIFKALGSDFDKTTLGGMVEGSIASLFDTLVKHFTDQGLSALGNAIGGSSATDNWSYQGNTLVTNSTVGGINTTSSAGPLSISPASVSIYPGNAINNITISGGTPPYVLLGTCDNGGAGKTLNVTMATCSTTTSGAGTWNPADPQFVSVSGNIDGSITVIGISSGTAGTISKTSVTIQDSSGQTITLPITITANADTTTPTTDPTGNCNYNNGAGPIPGVTKSACEGANGVWDGSGIVAPPPPSDPYGSCDRGDGNGPVKGVRQSDCGTLGGTWSETPVDPLGTCTVNNALGNTTGAATKSTCDASSGTWRAN
jgi:hypothetical protein